MGWNWSESIEEGLIIARDHIQETKGAVQDIAQSLEIDDFEWEHLPVDIGDYVKSDHIRELQDAVDYIDEWNYCHTEKTNQFFTKFENEEVSYDSTEEGSYYTSEEVGYDSSEDGTVRNNEHSSENDAEYSWNKGNEKVNNHGGT